MCSRVSCVAGDGMVCLCMQVCVHACVQLRMHACIQMLHYIACMYAVECNVM